eukprot:scaffold4361_cov17-Tisochrysis_lutea.AAC.1
MAMHLSLHPPALLAYDEMSAFIGVWLHGISGMRLPPSKYDPPCNPCNELPGHRPSGQIRQCSCHWVPLGARSSTSSRHAVTPSAGMQGILERKYNAVASSKAFSALLFCAPRLVPAARASLDLLSSHDRESSLRPGSN